MNDQAPSCIRVVVMAMYSDGTSQMVDIKDPASFETAWENDQDEDYITRAYTYAHSVTKFTLEARVSKKTPAIISSYPVKD